MKKETKEVGRELRPGKGIPSQEETLKKRGSQEETLKKRGFQTPGNILTAESVASFGSTEGNITGRKNK